jgi:hypothetical protein
MFHIRGACACGWTLRFAGVTLIQIKHSANYSVCLERETPGEFFMQIGNSTSAAGDDLLGCRMAMLGLDLSAIQSCGGQVFEAIKERCARCDCREACALDIRRDPNDPVWETYCPNTATLIALPEAWWLGAR